MHRLGIVGVDSSHTRVFGLAFNQPDPNPERRVAGARVVKLRGADTARRDELARELDAEPCIASRESRAVRLAEL